MRRLKSNILDFYIEYPIVFDSMVCTIFWIACIYQPIIIIKLPLIQSVEGIISSLISSNISLAGFMLAALTIIVTFKSNLLSKGIKDNNPENALELIFSTHHYDNIVSVFKKSIVEYTLSFTLLMYSWSLLQELKDVSIYRILMCSIFITISATTRSLLVLFIVLDLSKHSKKE